MNEDDVKGTMPGHDIIVIGASAGGVEALQQLVGDLPPDLPASIFIVLHIPPEAPSLLPSILERKARLPVISATDKLEYEPGHIYVAPPDHHLLVEASHLRVVRGPKESRHRPAVDPLFRTAAIACGARVVGVVLSGSLDDGTSGLWAVKACGGTTVVQDPLDAMFPCMPRNAMKNVEVDECLPLDEIAPLLIRLAQGALEKTAMTVVPENLEMEARMVMNPSSIDYMNRLGAPSGFTCPECNGTLWELKEGKFLRFRCHVGHSYLPDSLLTDQSRAVTSALYSAMRALEEKIASLRRIALEIKDKLPNEQARYEQQVSELEEQKVVIMQLIQNL